MLFTAFLYGNYFKGRGVPYADNYYAWMENIGVNVETLNILQNKMGYLWDEFQNKTLEPIEYIEGSIKMTMEEDQSEINRQVAKKIMKMLGKIYPKEMKVFNEIYQRLDKDLEDYNDTMKRLTKKRIQESS